MIIFILPTAHPTPPQQIRNLLSPCPSYGKIFVKRYCPWVRCVSLSGVHALGFQRVVKESQQCFSFRAYIRGSTEDFLLATKSCKIITNYFSSLA